MELVNAVQAFRLHVTHLIVDTLGDPAAYRTRLRALLPHIETITVESQADSTYKLVAAASIAVRASAASYGYWLLGRHLPWRRRPPQN